MKPGQGISCAGFLAFSGRNDMTVSLRDARTNPGDREWIERVYRDYLDDLGMLNTGLFPALGEIGHREPDQLQRWLVDSTATLLTILDDQQPAGFAMVAR